MSYVQYLEDLDYSISAQYDRFDGYDRGDIGRNQEYVPTAEEEAEMLRLAADYADTFVGPVQPANDEWTDIPF
jgi:hypothetical protein